MNPNQRAILSVILLMTGLVVLAYVPLVWLTRLEFSFATFALCVLFPCLGIYFAGVLVYRKAGKGEGSKR